MSQAPEQLVADRSSRLLEVNLGYFIPGEQTPLLKRRKELRRERVIKLWAQGAAAVLAGLFAPVVSATLAWSKSPEAHINRSR